MKTTISEETKTTPSIVLDNINNTLTIKGKSIPFEPELFWSFIINQTKKYEIKTIEFKLDYVNTNSISYLVKLINSKQINVIWVYEDLDEDMYELGKDLKSLSDSLFEFIELENLEREFVSWE